MSVIDTRIAQAQPNQAGSAPPPAGNSTIQKTAMARQQKSFLHWNAEGTDLLSKGTAHQIIVLPLKSHLSLNVFSSSLACSQWSFSRFPEILERNGHLCLMRQQVTYYTPMSGHHHVVI